LLPPHHTSCLGCLNVGIDTIFFAGFMGGPFLYLPRHHGPYPQRCRTPARRTGDRRLPLPPHLHHHVEKKKRWAGGGPLGRTWGGLPSTGWDYGRVCMRQGRRQHIQLCNTDTALFWRLPPLAGIARTRHRFQCQACTRPRLMDRLFPFLLRFAALYAHLSCPIPSMHTQFGSPILHPILCSTSHGREPAAVRWCLSY